MSIAENIQHIRSQIPDSVVLVAVTKTRPPADVQAAYDAGQRDFGENRIQEMCAKYEQLPEDIRWHMIGHVQTNKIRYMAPFVHLVHGCDREKVLREVNREARRNDRVIDVLLQVHIAREESKFGFNREELEELVASGRWKDFEHIRIRGLMGMSTFTNNCDQISEEFATLKSLFDQLQQAGHFSPFDILSMGMSSDYPIALENGSTMIRVGSSIFGARVS